MPGEQNTVEDTLSRPPEAVPTSESTTVAGVKVASGSLDDFLHVGGTPRASPGILAATVNSGPSPGIFFPDLAREQVTCEDVTPLHSSPVLDAQWTHVNGVELW